uniref:Beclin-1 n=1 Tax=Cyprinus carpio TaxID=7962 RepID=A0A8C2CZW5_CYPCA
MEGLKFSSNTMQVSFVCQRCSQPLKLDTSFNVLDRMTIHELTAPLLTVTANKQSESSEGSRFPEVSISRQQGCFCDLVGSYVYRCSSIQTRSGVDAVVALVTNNDACL